MIDRVLASTPECRDGNCPTAFLTDNNTVVVQGWTGSADVRSLVMPDGEGAVEIPVDLLLRAVAGMTAR